MDARWLRGPPGDVSRLTRQPRGVGLQETERRRSSGSVGLTGVVQITGRSRAPPIPRMKRRRRAIRKECRESLRDAGRRGNRDAWFSRSKFPSECSPRPVSYGQNGRCRVRRPRATRRRIWPRPICRMGEMGRGLREFNRYEELVMTEASSRSKTSGSSSVPRPGPSGG